MSPSPPSLTLTVVSASRLQVQVRIKRHSDSEVTDVRALAVSGKSTFGYVVDQQNAGSMDVGADVLTELGVAIVANNIADTLNYEPAPATSCQITWNGDCSAIGKTNLGGYCG